MAKAQKISIELDDLKDEPKANGTARVFPGLSQAGVTQYSIDAAGGKSKKPYFLALSEGIAIPRALAGLMGGSAAWVITEVVVNQDASSQTYLGAILGTMGWFAIVGALIGGAIRASEDIYVGRHEAAIKGFFIGAAVGLGTGLVSGLFAQIAYSVLGGGHESSGALLQIMARTFAFGFAGVLLGLGISLPSGLKQKIKAAAIGGLVGGLIGGFCFDTLGAVIALIIGGGGGVSRMLGLIVTGAAIGYGMGATENIYRDAWLQVTAGPFKGKQFILFKKDSWIGRDPSCDIVLVKDTYVADRHCLVCETPNGYRMKTNSASGAQVLINGAAFSEKILQPGDVIQIGYTQFVFRASEKKQA